MRPLFSAIVIVMLLAGCASKQHTGPGDAAYQKLADDYLDSYLAWHPQAGTSLGLHEYDGKISDFRQHSLQREYQRLKQSRDALAALDQAALSAGVSQANCWRRAMAKITVR
jgi:outer membrane murein-binding lipoprotein Lpp